MGTTGINQVNRMSFQLKGFTNGTNNIVTSNIRWHVVEAINHRFDAIGGLGEVGGI